MEQNARWKKNLSLARENLARNLVRYTREEMIVDDKMGLDNVQTAITLIVALDAIERKASPAQK